jgi:hypothetical protein
MLFIVVHPALTNPVKSSDGELVADWNIAPTLARAPVVPQDAVDKGNPPKLVKINILFVVVVEGNHQASVCGAPTKVLVENILAKLFATGAKIGPGPWSRETSENIEDIVVTAGRFHVRLTIRGCEPIHEYPLNIEAVLERLEISGNVLISQPVPPPTVF